MNVLLTGGAGYIGSHAALSLLDCGHNVHIVDDLSTGNESLIPKNAKFTNCNINEYVDDNICKPCPPGTENDSIVNTSDNNSTCSPILCGENEYVLNHVCTSCPDGTENSSGDAASGENTTCGGKICNLNEYVKDNQCNPCPPGSENNERNNVSNGETICSPILCDENE